MPNNLATATASAVFPMVSYGNITKYNESRSYPILFQEEKGDGTIISSLIQDGVNVPISVRTWTITFSLFADDFATLQTFYTTQQGPAGRWLFYDPKWQATFNANYDPTGVSTTGQFTCFFITPKFSFTTDINKRSTVTLSFQNCQ